LSARADERSWIGLVGVGVLAAACSREAAPGGETRWRLPVAERAADPFPRTIDLEGRHVVLRSPPVRIASATLCSDSVLLDVAPRERIAALHALSIDPMWSPVAEEARAFPNRIGGDPEPILALRPDFVILASFSREETRALLRKADCAVLTLPRFQTLADVEENLRLLGYALGVDQQAEGLIERMRGTLREVAAGAAARQRWRLLYWNDLPATAGDGTTFDELVQAVGARNAAAEAGVHGSRSLRSEEALVWDPDALVVGIVPGGEEAMLARLRQDPALAGLRCVRGGRVLFVRNALLQATCHRVALAAVAIAEQLDRWGKP
jgi:iron complex transport system substrate-binding protein